MLTILIKKYPLFLLFSLEVLGFFSPFLSHASDYWSPRTSSLGGAGHAWPLLNDAIYLNPSFMPFQGTHALSGSYLFYSDLSNSPLSSNSSNGEMWNVAILDSGKENFFQAGVGFTQRKDTSFFHLGASKGIIKELGVGLGFKFVLPGFPDGPHLNDGTLSVTGNFLSWLQFSLVVDNIFENTRTAGLYREFILGTRIDLKSIAFFYFDPQFVPEQETEKDRFGYSVGGEFPFFKDFFLRMGIFQQVMVPHVGSFGSGFAAGVSWMAPKISFEYSFSRVLAPFQVMAHQFGLSIFF